jgi:hypothetical protein
MNTADVGGLEQAVYEYVASGLADDSEKTAVAEASVAVNQTL